MLGPGAPQVVPALALPATAAVRAAALAGTAPAVISELAVEDDLATGRLVTVRTGARPAQDSARHLGRRLYSAERCGTGPDRSHHPPRS
ncbi:hypothetical protein ABT186_14670, partial [Streptomyces sp. NPDC001634]